MVVKAETCCADSESVWVDLPDVDSAKIVVECSSFCIDVYVARFRLLTFSEEAADTRERIRSQPRANRCDQRRRGLLINYGYAFHYPPDGNADIQLGFEEGSSQQHYKRWRGIIPLALENSEPPRAASIIESYTDGEVDG